MTTEPSGEVALKDDLADFIEAVDWPTFWATDGPDQDWLIEPIVPAGRQVAMYSAAKQGKSLLALDASAALATGRPLLGQGAVTPADVIYLDLEMTPADLKERLEDLGYGPDDDLSRLHYYQLPTLPPLNSELGGQVIEAVVTRWGASLLVIDTLTRVVTGKENENDPIRDFYRYSGRRLKVLGCALWRLDHAGKDPEAGQRGGSEKSGDVDVVFNLRVVEDAVVLRRTHSRVPWVPPVVTLERQARPNLAHILGDTIASPKVQEVMRDLANAGIPGDMSANAAMKALRDVGHGHSRSDVLLAVKIRKARSHGSV